MTLARGNRAPEGTVLRSPGADWCPGGALCAPEVRGGTVPRGPLCAPEGPGQNATPGPPSGSRLSFTYVATSISGRNAYDWLHVYAESVIRMMQLIAC